MSNLCKSAKTTSPSGNSGATPLLLIGSDFLYVETNGNISDVDFFFFHRHHSVTKSFTIIDSSLQEETDRWVDLSYSYKQNEPGELSIQFTKVAPRALHQKNGFYSKKFFYRNKSWYQFDL